jgi:hypothetical protein
MEALLRSGDHFTADEGLRQAHSLQEWESPSTAG